MRRISLYLLSIERQLHRQYAALKQRFACKTGRLFNENADAALTESVVREVRPALHVVAPRPKRLTRKQKRFQYISRNWSPLTPACPECKMSIGYPKRSWPTREWAEEARERQHDRHLLDIFPCPVQPGFFHLGHRKEQSEQRQEDMVRLAFYMRCIGVPPQSDPAAQYAGLDHEQQKLARRIGRRLIKKAGSLATAAAMFNTQIRDEQVAVTQNKSWKGGLLTEDY
jgi:uncharacterized protein YbaR (Trm112 family)